MDYFYSKNYIEYENNGDRDIPLSFKKYLHTIKPYLNDIINDFKISDKWKILLAL